MIQHQTKNQKPAALKALVFDFGGTLDGPGTGWYERLYHETRQVDPSIEWEEFLPFAKRAGNRLDQNPASATLSLSETVRHLVEYLVEHGNLTQRGVQSDHLIERFLSEAFDYLEQSKQVLESLAPRYRMACISNNWGNAGGWCADLGFDHYFEFVIDSTLVKIRKPDARIFHLALEKLNLPAEQVGYVGDQFHADVFGSKSVGMKSIWIEGKFPKHCPDASLVDVRLSSLTELFNWVTPVR